MSRVCICRSYRYFNTSLSTCCSRSFRSRCLQVLLNQLPLLQSLLVTCNMRDFLPFIAWIMKKIPWILPTVKTCCFSLFVVREINEFIILAFYIQLLLFCYVSMFYYERLCVDFVKFKHEFRKISIYIYGARRIVWIRPHLLFLNISYQFKEFNWKREKWGGGPVISVLTQFIPGFCTLSPVVRDGEKVTAGAWTNAVPEVSTMPVADRILHAKLIFLNGKVV